MLDFQNDRDRFAALGVTPDQIVWRGRPRGGVRFRSGDIFAVPFSLVWGGFVFVMIVPALLNSPLAFPMIIVGPLFVCMAIYITVGRFLLDMYLRSQTYYAVTADAALIRREGLLPTNRSIYLPSVQNLNLDLAADGSGTIIFGDPPGMWNATGWSGGRGWGSSTQSPEFGMVPKAAEVFALCQRAQRGGRAAAS